MHCVLTGACIDLLFIQVHIWLGNSYEWPDEAVRMRRLGRALIALCDNRKVELLFCFLSSLNRKKNAEHHTEAV